MPNRDWLVLRCHMWGQCLPLGTETLSNASLFLSVTHHRLGRHNWLPAGLLSSEWASYVKEQWRIPASSMCLEKEYKSQLDLTPSTHNLVLGSSSDKGRGELTCTGGNPFPVRHAKNLERIFWKEWTHITQGCMASVGGCLRGSIWAGEPTWLPWVCSQAKAEDKPIQQDPPLAAPGCREWVTFSSRHKGMGCAFSLCEY